MSALSVDDARKMSSAVLARSSESGSKWPYVRSICSTDVPISRESSKRPIHAAIAKEANVCRGAYGGRCSRPAALTAGVHSSRRHSWASSRHACRGRGAECRSGPEAPRAPRGRERGGGRCEESRPASRRASLARRCRRAGRGRGPLRDRRLRVRAGSTRRVVALFRPRRGRAAPRGLAPPRRLHLVPGRERENLAALGLRVWDEDGRVLVEELRADAVVEDLAERLVDAPGRALGESFPPRPRSDGAADGRSARP